LFPTERRTGSCCHGHHLLSSLHLLACRSTGLSWRTFTMSRSLQASLGLLRRLRPPVRALAFSRPSDEGQAAWEFPNSNIKDVIATRSCLLYAGWIRDNMGTVYQPAHPPPSLLGWVSQPLSPIAGNDALTGSSRQPRSQDWSVNRCVVSSSRTFVRRLQTLVVAPHERLLRSPHTVVQVRLLRSNP
jgi:hypothetical protein